MVEWMSAPVVSAIMTGVLYGLHAAHEAVGEDRKPACIVHRDVSPQNILVGVDGVARLLDFGVSRAAGQLHTTREGVVKGKLAYMAPEQAMRGVANRQTDVFSAAVVLWEALTRQRLFFGENDAVIYTNVIGQTIEPPSRVVAHLPSAVDAVVMRGLERDPAKRCATAGEMAIALEDAIAPATARRVGGWVRRVAAERLGERAEIVSKLESDASSRTVPDAEPRPEVRDPPDEAQTSSLSVSQRIRGGLGLRRVLVGGGVALFAGGVLAVAIHGNGLPETAAQTANPPPPPAASTAEVPATVAAPAPPPPIPSAPVSAVAPSSNPTPAAPTRNRRPGIVVGPRPSAAAKPVSTVTGEPVFTRE
jgi:serine/threonine protein kinase